MKSGLSRGQLTKWKDDRGFGFIQPVDGSQEVFIHISELKDATRRPQVGDTICYRTLVEDGKTRACNAFIVGARSQPTAASSTNKSASNAGFAAKFPVLEVFLLSVIPVLGAVHFAWKTGNPLPLLLYPAMSLVTFALYADDKSRAQQGNWRTSEKTLHLCELAGGWLGGFIAQRKLRHKSRKGSYQTMFWFIVILHHIIWLGWLFFGKAFTS